MPVHYALLSEIPDQTRHGIRLHGPDTRRFVQGTVSANIEPIPADRAVPAALLTVKGKLVSELLVLADAEDALMLLVPASVATPVAELLERHIIMDDVEVDPRGEVVVAVAWSDDPTWAGPAGTAGVRVMSTRHPAPSHLLWATDGGAGAIAAALPGASPADPTAYDAWRVTTASPGWGRELEPDHFPPEVGFVYAVSYDKGCYMGQEPLARIHARGQVNWVMVQISAAAPVAATPGNPVALAHPRRPVAGRLTTWVSDAEGTRGLAIVRREFAVLDTELHMPDGASIRVVSGPKGDDPGIRG